MVMATLIPTVILTLSITELWTLEVAWGINHLTPPRRNARLSRLLRLSPAQVSLLWFPKGPVIPTSPEIAIISEIRYNSHEDIRRYSSGIGEISDTR